MKKILLSVATVMVLGTASFAQLVDEANVTINMELQPVLQLKMEGPDQIDFTFDEIKDYVAGITRYGATVLKVSSTVSADLWATGLSTANDFIWDNPVEYMGATANAIDEIPITALELRQHQVNPSIAGCALSAVAASSDYSAGFVAAGTAGNNCVFTTSNATPFARPTSTAAAATSEKYIGGASTVVDGCQLVGGTYLTAPGGVGSNYYYVLDYRILPSLPAVFPMSFAVAANQVNLTAPGNVSAAGATTLDAGAGEYAMPGVYTMYVKYILAEDL